MSPRTGSSATSSPHTLLVSPRAIVHVNATGVGAGYHMMNSTPRNSTPRSTATSTNISPRTSSSTTGNTTPTTNISPSLLPAIFIPSHLSVDTTPTTLSNAAHAALSNSTPSPPTDLRLTVPPV
jgi:hypothetical protein